MDPNSEIYHSFKGRISENKVFCGRLSKKQTHQLFKEVPQTIRSLALIPLKNQGIEGYLALGSYEDTRFHPGIGTEFLIFMGKFITQSLQRYIPATSSK